MIDRTLYAMRVSCVDVKKYRTGNSCLPKTTSEAWGTTGLATICNNSLCPQNYPPYVVGNISEHRTPKRSQKAKQQIFFQHSTYFGIYKQHHLPNRSF
jgi:hypothetical protein